MKSPGKNTPARRLLDAGADRDLVAKIRAAHVRAVLKQHVKTCGQLVDADWHDGYEEQDEELTRWLLSCIDFVGVALHLVLTYRCGFKLAHDVVKIVADSFDQLTRIPFRCGPDSPWVNNSFEAELRLDGLDLDMDSEDDTTNVTITSYEELVKFAWPVLLGAAADTSATPRVRDTVLLRMIKDACDFEVEDVHKPSQRETRLKAGIIPDAVRNGRDRLKSLVVDRKPAWSRLKTAKKNHLYQMPIDRRYDGTPGRRTRNYHLFQNEDGELDVEAYARSLFW
eukprot:m.75981 g.75981  ORF g.75981 m.75981 type:complete len:282 (-) comp14499_c0_seq1:937-1782(-)